MLEKMQAAGGQRSSKNDQRARKRPQQASSGAGQLKRERLDGTTVGYFRRVTERLNEGFTDPEEKALFVENVLSEVKGKARLVALDMTGSVALERLLSLADAGQVAEMMSELGGEAGSEFRGVSCDQCGGHVMESALRQAHRWTEETPAEENPEEEHCGMLETQVQSLSRAVREKITEFCTDPYGSHVLRTLIHVLSGCRSVETTAPHAKKDRKSKSELMDFEIPTSFWWELKHLADCLMVNIKVCVSNQCAGVALQTLLTVCHRKRPILCRKLNKSIMGYLTSLSSAPGVSPLLVFLKDPSSSHLLQSVFSCSHDALLRNFYKKHLKTHMMTLALHPIANYTVQSLIAAAAGAGSRVLPKILDELLEGFEAVLAAGHMGVVVQMVESCVHCVEKQSEMMQRLLQAFHCSEPASLQLCCLPLFLSLLTHEVYYNTETAEGDTAAQAFLCSSNYVDGGLYHLPFAESSVSLNGTHSSKTQQNYMPFSLRGNDMNSSHLSLSEQNTLFKDKEQMDDPDSDSDSDLSELEDDQSGSYASTHSSDSEEEEDGAFQEECWENLATSGSGKPLGVCEGEIRATDETVDKAEDHGTENLLLLLPSLPHTQPHKGILKKKQLSPIAERNAINRIHNQLSGDSASSRGPSSNEDRRGGARRNHVNGASVSGLMKTLDNDSSESEC